jgi:predicted Zn-dependent protease
MLFVLGTYNKITITLMKKSLFIIFLFLVIYGCSQVPVTGRKQMAWVPSGQLFELSFQNYSQTLKETPLSKNAAQTKMLKDVGRNIQKAVEEYMSSIGKSKALEGYVWEFNLLEGDIVNAWAMPGGKVAFYEGIMPICRDETGIAVVMGHEIAHAVADHGNERLTHGLIQQGLGTALMVAMQNEPQVTQQLAMSAFGVGSTVFGILPYSRLHESEADHLGLIFMAMAGYDPQAAPEFWKRMAASSSGGAKPPEFLSTHPADETRIANLNKWMPEAMKYYKKNQ